MVAKQNLIGFIIFTLVTLAIFFMVSVILHFHDSVSVVLAIAGGFGAEILYRKKCNNAKRG